MAHHISLPLRCQSYESDRGLKFEEQTDLGGYSTDENNKFVNDRSQLKKYTPPANPSRCYFDLTKDYDKMIHRAEQTREGIDFFLHWLMENKERLYQLPGGEPKENPIFESLNTDFVCRRGLLSDVMTLPYASKRADVLHIAVIKFRGTHFLCKFNTPEEKKQMENMDSRQKKECSIGHKFEQYMTSDMDADGPDLSRPVNTNETFHCMTRSKLDNHSLLISAEVDCIDENKKYVELKTSLLPEENSNPGNFYRFKLLKWWSQSFIIGIPRVVCGFKTRSGIVECIKEYQVKNMPAEAKSKIENPWKPHVCINFLSAFLNFVKSIATEDRAVYVFEWSFHSGVTYRKQPDSDTEHQFLHNWFLEWDAWDQPL